MGLLISDAAHRLRPKEAHADPKMDERVLVCADGSSFDAGQNFKILQIIDIFFWKQLLESSWLNKVLFGHKYFSE